MKKINSIYINILTIFLLEIIFILSIFKSITFATIIFVLLIGTILAILLNFLTRLLKKEKLNKVFNIIIFFFISLVFAAQFIHYKFYDAIFSLYSMFNGAGQITQFMDTILKTVLNNWYIIIILFLPMILVTIFNKRINYERIKLKEILIYFIIAISFFFISLILINDDKENPYSNYNIIYSVHAPTISVKKLGLTITTFLDIKRYFFGFTEKNLSIIDNKVVFEENVEYNIMKIDFETLINNETDEVYKEMDEYFNSVSPTNKNSYTGYFEGKNLVLIVGEAVNIVAIDQEHTPTLYKLTHEGFVFNNFYTPIYYVSTSDGEYTALNSLLPKEGVWSFPESKNNYLPFSFGNAFKSNNYSTFAYHDGTHTYYSRYLTHPNIGFDTFKACGSGLKINCNIWPQSDYEMINATYNDYIKDDLFLTYYMTISTHLNYRWTGNTMAAEHQDEVQDLDLSEQAKGYVATHIELDNALNLLIEKLEQEGKLEDTVFVMVADHYPYGLKNNEMYEFRDDIEEEKFDLHKNFFAIWNSEMKEPIIVDKYASNIDVLPTILNMFNIEYDSRLLAGNDIFSESDGIVIFNDRSFITDKGKYNALTNTFTAFDENEKVTEEYINDKINYVYNRFFYSRLILEKDYYRYLFK